jgi:hypothetical protein
MVRNVVQRSRNDLAAPGVFMPEGAQRTGEVARVDGARHGGRQNGRDARGARWARALLAVALVVALVATDPAGASGAGPDPEAPVPAMAAAPDRVQALVIGDSILRESSDEAAAELAAHGVRAVIEGIDGSGLLTGFDWIARATELVAVHDPELVVVMFSGNYAPPLLVDPATGADIVAGSPTMLSLWDRAADALMAVITARGARVLWVGAPPMRPGSFWETYDAVGALGPGIAARWPQATYLDAGVVLAGPGRTFTPSGPACGADRVDLRDPDGAHLSPAGERRFGTAIAEAVVEALRSDRSVEPARTTPAVGITAVGGGYRIVSCGGELTDHATTDLRPTFGSVGTGAPVVATAAAPGGGQWMVTASGTVLAVDAPHLGDLAGTALRAPIVGMAAAPSGVGYWLVASDGGVFAFGSAPFLGSTGAIRLNRPIVGMAAAPSGVGYWLVASDGGVFAFGSAPFFGSTGALTLNAPITGIATHHDGLGYWLVARDGGVFAFGRAAFFGAS